ncbi:uncharacterized protein L201_006410 [Kwoniella dendrophila CBS 6074]|uniref:Methyltransferase domain-containing protein n=1 Tax=Kwoniella dendrophila CBS 6074 TaxID=1295534 RepID=A0AAX4K2Y0_9TREE
MPIRVEETEPIAPVSVEKSGVKEHNDGRLYTASQEYALPADEEESDRLNSQHKAIVMTFNGHIPEPIKTILLEKEKPRILDVGCGTGNWSVEVADQLPKALVTGVDLVSIHPKEYPSNVDLKRLDILEDLPEGWEGSFDLIHARYLVFGINNFNTLIPRLQKLLKPNGYLMMLEPEVCFRAEGYDSKTSKAVRFAEVISEASDKLGRNPVPGKVVSEYLQSSNDFDQVETVVGEIPLSPWADDERLKEIGIAHQPTALNYGSALKRLVMKAGIHSEQEYEEVCNALEEAVLEGNMKLIIPSWMITARKI